MTPVHTPGTAPRDSAGSARRPLARTSQSPAPSLHQGGIDHAHEGVDIHDIVLHAERILSGEQLAATRLHLLGDSDEAIAGTLGLAGAPAAYKAWHGAVMRLRYRFVVRGGGGP